MRFPILYVDPPWEFRMVKTGGNFKSGAAYKYPTMKLREIISLPVPAVVSPNAYLFLWVPTALKFSHGGPTMAAWGFQYVTTYYWDKQKLGMGAWFRNEVEELLVAKRGNVAPFMLQEPNILHQRPGEHSAKPEDIRRVVERATKSTLKRNNLEIFARQEDPAWTGIGNAITGNDVRVDLLNLARAA